MSTVDGFPTGAGEFDATSALAEPPFRDKYPNLRTVSEVFASQSGPTTSCEAYSFRPRTPGPDSDRVAISRTMQPPTPWPRSQEPQQSES